MVGVDSALSVNLLIFVDPDVGLCRVVVFLSVQILLVFSE